MPDPFCGVVAPAATAMALNYASSSTETGLVQHNTLGSITINMDTGV